MTDPPRIRRAGPDEAEALTALARRAKAHWPYSHALLATFAAEIALTPLDIERDEVWVLDADRPVGFHRVVAGEPAILEDLWVDPVVIGRGHGRALWSHAVAVACATGARALELDADPHAIGFYERMGAIRIGDTPSAVVPGRMLPRMRIDLE